MARSAILKHVWAQLLALLTPTQRPYLATQVFFLIALSPVLIFLSFAAIFILLACAALFGCFTALEFYLVISRRLNHTSAKTARSSTPAPICEATCSETAAAPNATSDAGTCSRDGNTATPSSPSSSSPPSSAATVVRPTETEARDTISTSGRAQQAAEADATPACPQTPHERLHPQATPGRLLGRGAQGSVTEYTGPQELGAHRTYAVKHTPHFAGQPPSRTLWAEAQLLLAADDGSGAVTRCLGYARDACGEQLMLELLTGGDLASAEQIVGASPEAVRYLFASVLRGLHALHAAGAGHYDLKPANVLLSASGQVKLADLGVGRLLARGIPAGAGSIGWQSPEQQVLAGLAYAKSPQYVAARDKLLASVCGSKCDVWVWGLTCLAAVSGLSCPGYVVRLADALTARLSVFAGSAEPYELKEAARPIQPPRPSEWPFERLSPLLSALLLEHVFVPFEERWSAAQLMAHPYFAGFDFEGLARMPSPLLQHMA